MKKTPKRLAVFLKKQKELVRLIDKFDREIAKLQATIDALCK